MKQNFTRLILFLIGICPAFCIHADSFYPKHIVERGETWESIASYYNCSATLLQQANPEFNYCFAGAELEIPKLMTDAELDHLKVIRSNPAYEEAKQAYMSEDFKKSVKIYNSLIKEGGADLEAYYYRGISQWRRGKYSQAIKDLDYVTSMDSNGLYPDASKISQEAWSAREEQRSNRSKLWGSLVGTVLMTGAQIYTATQMNKDTSTGISTSNSTLGYSSSLNSHLYGSNINYQAVSNQILQQTWNEYQQQTAAEYQQYCNSCYSNGINPMSQSEWELLRAQAYSNTDEGSNVNYDITDYGDGITSQTVTTEKDCYNCHGSGRCPTCNGSTLFNGSECPNCWLNYGKRTGKCRSCRGTGKNKSYHVEISH